MRISPPLNRKTSLLHRFCNDERGMIVSAELMIIMTVGVIALVTGVSTVASALNCEYTDIANALNGLDQSYRISGHFAGSGRSGGGAGGAGCGQYHAFNRGMGFNDSGNSFYVQGGGASVAGSFHQSAGGFISTNAIAANTAVATEAFALVEESVLVVDEVVDAEAVCVTEEALLEERLAQLEEEALRLEQAQTTVQSSDVCPLDELRELECRIRRLRERLDQQNVFDCDQTQQ